MGVEAVGDVYYLGRLSRGDWVLQGVIGGVGNYLRGFGCVSDLFSFGKSNDNDWVVREVFF